MTVAGELRDLVATLKWATAHPPDSFIAKMLCDVAVKEADALSAQSDTFAHAGKWREFDACIWAATAAHTILRGDLTQAITDLELAIQKLEHRR